MNAPDPVTAGDIEDAAHRLAAHLAPTPLFVSGPLSDRATAAVAVKAEYRQPTGSFKIRGALNALLTLDPGARRAGVVTASSGNHGLAVATAAAMTGIDAAVHLPMGAERAKREAIERTGVRVVVVDSTDAHDAERSARSAAEAEGRRYLSPYNDPAVVAGAGTVALELVDQMGDAGLDGVDVVVVAVGGGGLVAGVATWLAERSPSTLVVGASPANDAAIAASVAAGAVVDVAARPTFSDGTAGGIDPDTVTLDPCRQLVGAWTTVTEPAIAAAVADMIDDHHQVVEGAAGVALAAAVGHGRRAPGARIVVVGCGANVSAATLGRMLMMARSPEAGGEPSL
ncbi:MAG: pyridoxal-phosphate dependent enzyme [Acidimicrobiales bacterium]